MDERASGIILRTRPLTETSLIVVWLTEECGRVSTVAKGARRAKSPFIGKLDLYYEGEFTFARSRRSDLHTLREVVLRETNRGLRENLHWLGQAAYFGVLIELATETETPIPEVHGLLRGTLAELPRHAPDPKTTFAFELKLLSLLGFEPDFARAGISEEARSTGRILQESSWEEIARLRPSRSQLGELNRTLMRAVAMAWERIPAQRSAAAGCGSG